MNVICIMLDSLRTDHVGAYGHAIEQLREFDPRKLDLSEDDYTKSNNGGRGYDAERYAAWIR
ncbi:MAG: hypothetical protein HOH74_32365, partial [Gemmatimonadetes bacterium]|nr:hypothetical protein [Gemmatimonadota bacterium]